MFKFKVTAIFVAAVTLLMFVSHAFADEPAIAAHQVMERFLGDRATDFSFEIIPPEKNELPVYEYQVTNGRVTVRGSSGVALCRGAYDYLKSHGYAMFTWGGKTLTLPVRFPDETLHRVVSPFRFNQAYNVCGFGYTTPFWHWDDWRHELDWLALHGYNLAIAMEGQEGVWDRVWKEQGLTDADLKDFYCGPAYLPWFRMGNINGFMGPLPPSWMATHIQLQHQILAGMNDLGIQPIVPAFSGFVPKAWARLKPDLLLHPHTGWAGFQKENGTLSLDIASPEYSVMLQRFIKAYEVEYGRQKYFLVDCFNEIDVPVSPNRTQRLEQLAAYGNNISRGITAAEPNGTWVMQGWMFRNDRQFWDPESVRALLSKVPNDRMIILDLSNESFHGWEELDAFYGKQWILSYIPTFGGNDAVNGPLQLYATAPRQALQSPKKGNLVGLARAEEGFENNEVTYELLSDAAWSPQSVDLQSWIVAYCRARYGVSSPEVEQAWKLLSRTAYAKYLEQGRYGYENFPPHKGNVDPKFEEAVALFLKAGSLLHQNQLYCNDAIEFTTQAVAARVDLHVQDALQAAELKDWPLYDRYSSEAIGAIKQLDLLSASHPNRRLSRWIDQARSWGTTSQESDLYEENVRRILTVWGASLSDYACRNWSGMLGEYYAGRLAAYFQALKAGTNFNVTPWEEKWIKATNLSPEKVLDDPLQTAGALLTLTQNWSSEHLINLKKYVADQGIPIGGWSPAQMSTDSATLEWPMEKAVTGSGTYEVNFQYKSGQDRLDISDVQLVQANVGVVAEDKHDGTTGDENENNHYRLILKDRISGAAYTLRAKVRSDGGTESTGQVSILAPK